MIENPAAMCFSDHVFVVILIPILISTDRNGYGTDTEENVTEE